MANVTVNYTAAELPHVLNKISGKNLLHNPDFSINQRGQSSYTPVWDGYTLDRYNVEADQDLTVTVNSDNVIITNNSSSTSRQIKQTIEQTFPAGISITGSAKILASNGGVSISVSETVSPWRSQDKSIYGAGIVSATFLTPAAMQLKFAINLSPGASVTLPRGIPAAKLEEDMVSTLANDPPADYGEELLKCKRFYRLWTTESARTEALKEVGLMRLASPTVGTIDIGGVTYYYASADL
jgi:hypothetical protein